jgi:hypothetical protein
VPPTSDRPRLTVRVGVSGHRADALAASDATALRGRVRELLSAIAAEARGLLEAPGTDYAATDPRIVLTSSLAAGADTLVANEALALGYELQAPLPFTAADYAADFSAEGRAELDRLRARATAVLELDGDRRDSTQAYAIATTTMLHQSEILIAIWDGKTDAPRGGTAWAVQQARMLGIPVLRIDSARPHALHGTVAGLVETLYGSGGTDDAVRAVYFAPPPARSGWGVFRRFRALLETGARPRHSEMGAAPPMPEDRVPTSDLLIGTRTSADAVAESYAARYRDAFIANYIMGALAVLMALVGFVSPVGTIVELALIIAILIVTRRGGRGRWHERWLGYRLFAEQLRQIELLRPLGRVPDVARKPVDAEVTDGNPLWVSWLTRARTREAGMAAGVVSPKYLDAYRAELDALLHDQASYHERSAHRQHVLAHRLHAMGTGLFFVTALVCVAHLGVEVWHHLHETTEAAEQVSSAMSLNGVLTLVAAVLPAFGAAFAGISTQGEFERGANRSHSMKKQLAALRARLAASPATSVAYAGIAEETVRVMSEELLEWQATVRAKPLVLPA